MSESRNESLRSFVQERLASEAYGLPTSRLGRLAQTASALTRGGALSLRRSLGRRLGRGALSAEALAAFVAAVGGLKGAGMKWVQLLSYVDADLPDDARTALAVLQTHAQPMPLQQVRQIVADDLRAAGQELVQSLSRVPLAAASIGQVHQGTLADGTAVAVKVRYPGIELAVASDFAPAAAASKLAARLLPGSNLEGFVQEARERLLEECDYRLEAKRQQRFAELFAGHPVLVVPKVHPGCSSHRVLTTTFYQGRHLEAWLSTQPTQAERDRAGRALFDFYLGSLFHHGLYNCDPHPGNYLFLADGRIAVLDHGCARAFEPELVQRLAALTRAVNEDEPDGLQEALAALGLRAEGRAYDAAVVRGLVRAFYGPMLRDEVTAFAPEDALGLRQVLVDRRALLRLSLPGELLFVLRVRVGLAAVLARLGARANWHALEAEVIAAVPAPAARPLADAALAAEPAGKQRSGNKRHLGGLYDVVLVDAGDEVIRVIREIRAVTGLPMRDVRDLVQNRPRTIRAAVPRHDAEALQQSLAAVGARTELRMVGQA